MSTKIALHHILIDHENIHAIDLEPLKDSEAVISIFTGENQRQFSKQLVTQLSHHKYEIIDAGGSGKNALDFHMAYHAGRIFERAPHAFVHFVTKDKGFDPLVKYLKGKSLHANRVNAIAELAFLRTKAGAAGQSVSQETVASLTDEQRKRRALTTLIKMGAARPRKLKTLKSSLHSHFSKILTEDQLTALIETLRSDGSLSIGAAEKISYSLGAASSFEKVSD